MSMHKIPLTPLEEEGLRLHGLPIGTPSQRSDTFRQGVAWAIGEAKRLAEENERLQHIARAAQWYVDNADSPKSALNHMKAALDAAQDGK